MTGCKHENLDKALHDAVKSGNAALVKSLLDRGADKNAALDYSLVTPLHIACKAGDLETATILVGHGISRATINATTYRDNDGATPLHHAAATRNTRLVNLLLDNGANINAPTISHCWGTTALHIATHNNDIPMMTLLLEQGAHHSPLDFRWMSPLHGAAAHGCREALELLAGVGASLDAMDRDGATPLYHAAWHLERSGDPSLVRTLISLGAQNTMGHLAENQPLPLKTP